MNVKFIYPASLLALLLTACGGGGGGHDNRQAIDNRPSPSAAATVSAGSSTGSALSADNPAPRDPAAEETGPLPGIASAPLEPAMPAEPVRPPADPTVLIPIAPLNPASSPETALPSVDDDASSGRLPAATVYSGYMVTSDNGTYGSPSSFSDGKSSQFTVTVDENKIRVTLNSENPATKFKLEDPVHGIKELKDVDGSLLGYYGWASSASIEPARNGTAENEKYPLLDIFYAIDQTKARLPALAAGQVVQYAGVFQYAQKGQNTMREATHAVFSYQDKKIDGSIRDGVFAHWVVAGDKTVEDDGTFNIRLESKASGINSGEMQGGFFGKDGQILAAKAESTGGSDKDEWAGIFVAKQRPIPTP